MILKDLLKKVDQLSDEQTNYLVALIPQLDRSITYTELVAEAHELARQINLPESQFAMGVLFERQGEFEKALDRFKLGNLLCRKRAPFNV
ncbi:MAG: hypothetical protein JJ956_09185 [Pseudomonadales bacterium]|nr:hypothetical protein [Pseudomonadales bacterium]